MSTNPGRVLFAFGLSTTGLSLLRIAARIAPLGKLEALHFLDARTMATGESTFHMAESFEAIKGLAQELQVSITFTYREASDITAAILNQSDVFRAELLLVGPGMGRPSDPLGGRVGELIRKSSTPVAVCTRPIVELKSVVVISESDAPGNPGVLFQPGPDLKVSHQKPPRLDVDPENARSDGDTARAEMEREASLVVTDLTTWRTADLDPTTPTLILCGARARK